MLNKLFILDLLHMLENRLTENVFNPNPNPKAQLKFVDWRNDVIFGESVQIPFILSWEFDHDV